MEKKRFGISICVIMLAGILLTWILASMITREQNAWIYEVTDNLLIETVKKYPDVEEETIRKILSGKFFTKKRREKFVIRCIFWNGSNYVLSLCRVRDCVCYGDEKTAKAVGRTGNIL